jgi:hypothetical protein
MNHVRGVFVCALIVSTLFAAAASAAPWTNPSGSASDYDWSNGESDNGLFGSPTLIGESLFFFPSDFKAESTSATPTQTQDRLRFTITAKPGLMISQVTINETGNYSILGNGSVDVTGLLSVTNQSGPGLVTDALATSPSMPVATSSSAQGGWTGSAIVSPPFGWTTVQVELDNVLSAVATGGAASIYKTITEVQIQTLPIPEPSAAGLLLLAGGSLLARRRR